MQHQHAIVAVIVHCTDDGIAHCQPVVLLHVGTVEQRVHFLQRPLHLGCIAQLGEVFAHPRIETTGRCKAFGGFEHADGAAGVEDEKIRDCTHGKHP
ncbi:hypothetical protein D3C75_1244450 [compost metagenome]